MVLCEGVVLVDLTVVLYYGSFVFIESALGSVTGSDK